MKSTSRFGKNNQGITCLNCEQPISDKDHFCSNCGQVNDTSRLSLKTYFSEYLAGFFSFDNRFLKTVAPLIFKPGKVTKEYVEGKRMRFVNPFQLYINISIIFFLILSLLKTVDSFKNVKNSETNTNSQEVIQDADIIADSIQTATKAELKKSNVISNPEGLKLDDSLIQGKILLPKFFKKDTTINANEVKIEKHLDSVFRSTEILQLLKNSTLSKSQKDSVFNVFYENNNQFILDFSTQNQEVKIEKWDDIEKINKLKQFSLGYIESVLMENNLAYKIPEIHKNSLQIELLQNIASGSSSLTKIKRFIEYGSQNKEVSVLEALQNLGYDKTYWNIFIYNKSQNLNKFLQDEEYRNSYSNNIISKISVALFFLLPIFTLIVSLIYIRNKNNYTEHLVFVFHVQTVFFILLLISMLIDSFFQTSIGLIAFCTIFPYHLFKSMQNFYEQGKIKTLIKYLLLNIFFAILALIGGIIISFIAFLV